MNAARGRPMVYRALHWTLAVLVAAQWADGWLFVTHESALGPKPYALGMHASLGALTLLCALILAAWWIARHGWRATLARDAGNWMGPVAVAVHAGLLTLIAAEAALGLGGLELVGTPVYLFGAALPTTSGTQYALGLRLLAGERYLGYLLAALALLHAAAALYHRFRLRDDVLAGMGLGG